MDDKKKKAILIALAVIFFIVIIVKVTDRAIIKKGKVPLYSNNRIGVVNIYGPMFDSKKTIDLLHKYDEDKSIKAIILRLDTPGGGVAVAQEIVTEINKIRGKGKKVVSSMGSIAASGGYYVACTTDKIFADAGTLTGSIGVIMELPNIEELLKKIGVKIDVIKSGEHKDIGSPSRKLTPKEQRLLQDVIDDVYEQFVEAIADGRNDVIKQKIADERGIEKKDITIEDVKAKIRSIADGRIFSGRQALAFGLVDELGNFYDSVEKTAEMSGIEGKPVLVEEKKKINFFDVMFGENSESIVQFIKSLQYIPLQNRLK